MNPSPSSDSGVVGSDFWTPFVGFGSREDSEQLVVTLMNIILRLLEMLKGPLGGTVDADGKLSFVYIYILYISIH